MIRMRHGATLLALVLLFAGCGGDSSQEPGFNVFTPEEDVQIGKECAQKVYEELPMLGVPEVDAYVQSVGDRLAAHAPGERFTYEFHVVNIPGINAFALPGGIVFVNRGTLETVRDEGELAGVLAHEICHVALRHGTNQMSKAYVAERGFSVFRRIVGGGKRSGSAEDVAGAVGGLGLNTLFLKFSREAEMDADLAGAKILADAGYDPIEMSRLFDTIRRAARGRQKPPEFLSDHPDTGNRAQAVSDIRATLHVSPTPITITDEFWKMKSALTLLPSAPMLEEQRVGPR